MQVTKRDGRIEEFSRAKVENTIRQAIIRAKITVKHPWYCRKNLAYMATIRFEDEDKIVTTSEIQKEVEYQLFLWKPEIFKCK